MVHTTYEAGKSNQRSWTYCWEVTGSMSETACKTRDLKSSNVPSFALSNLATNVSSTESGLDGREEESTFFHLSVFVAELLWVWQSGSFHRQTTSCGPWIQSKMVRPLKASTLAHGSSEVRQLSVKVRLVPSASSMSVTRRETKSSTGTGRSCVPFGTKNALLARGWSRINIYIVLQNPSISMMVRWVKSCRQTSRNLRLELSMKFIAQRCKVIYIRWMVQVQSTGTKVNLDEQPWLLVHQVFSKYMRQGSPCSPCIPAKVTLQQKSRDKEHHTHKSKNIQEHHPKSYESNDGHTHVEVANGASQRWRFTV